MSILSSINPLSLKTKLIAAASLLLVGIGIGSYLGYSVAYTNEHSKLEVCEDKLSAAVLAQAKRESEGASTLAGGVSSNEAAKTDSSGKRQDVLKNSKPSTVQVCPSPSSTSACSCPAVAAVLPKTFSLTINKLLEVSNETGFYSAR